MYDKELALEILSQIYQASQDSGYEGAADSSINLLNWGFNLKFPQAKQQ